MPHTHGVISRTRLHPLADLRPQAIPPCKDRRAAAAAPTTPPGSLTGVGMRPRPEIEREFNCRRHRNLSGSLGCTVPGHPRCASLCRKRRSLCAIHLANYLHLPSAIYLPPIIYHLLRSVCILCSMRWWKSAHHSHMMLILMLIITKLVLSLIPGYLALDFVRTL